MATITYRKSNDGEPAKVFSGTMDRLLFMIVLRMKEKSRNKKPKTFSLCTTEFAAERSNRVGHCYSCGMVTHIHTYYLVDSDPGFRC